MPHLLVFGARNLGRVIGEHFLAQGWDATGVARSQETADAFPGAGIVADATSAESMRGVVEQVAPFDLVVNAVSPKGRFGGGDLVTTDDDAMAPYLEQVLPTAFAFFRICGARAHRARRRHDRPGDGRLGPPCPARPGAVGQPAPPASARSQQAAANELKPHGVHAALLVCDGTFGGPGDDAGGERIDTARAREGRPVPARAGAKRMDARAGGDARRRPLDAVDD